MQRHWEDYDGYLLQQGLDEQLPANQRGIDRRGFEWFDWRRKRRPGIPPSMGIPVPSRAWPSALLAEGLASASSDPNDRTVRVWEATTGKMILRTEGPRLGSGPCLQCGRGAACRRRRFWN